MHNASEAEPTWDEKNGTFDCKEPLDMLDVRKLLTSSKFEPLPTPSKSSGFRVYVNGRHWATFVDAHHAMQAQKLLQENCFIHEDVEIGI